MNECPACNYRMDPLKGTCPECGADFTQLSRKIFDRFKAWRSTDSSLKIIRGIYLAMILIMFFGWGMDLLYLVGSWIFPSNSSFYGSMTWLVVSGLSITEFGIMIGMLVAVFLLPIAPFRDGPLNHQMILALRVLILMNVVRFVGVYLFPEWFFKPFSSELGVAVYQWIMLGLQWIPSILILLILMQISNAFYNPELRRKFKMMMIFLLAQIPYTLLMTTLETSTTVQKMLGLSGEDVIWYQMSDGMKIFIQTGNILSMIAAFIYVLMGWIFIGQLRHSIGLILASNLSTSPAPPKAGTE